ncbi:MAG: ATP-binding cassette domain-containing protein, partial [Pseudomonadota bacterium]
MSYLSLKNVSKSYGDAKILSDVSIDVAEGEFVAIVGFSGSGKTTLMNILAGLEQPDTGEATFR